MAAEALAVVGSVSAVVQLVAFSSKCISKGVELYRSGDGILDENAAVELAANHLTTLRVQVEAEAARLSDAVLQEFCRAVANTSSELLKALEKLKIQGNNTKWKTLRKAIKSVWSKEEILDLEHRLSSFRSELNLHITISTKQQLESLGSDIESRFRNTSETQKRIIDAILQDRSVFETSLQDQSVLLQTISEEIKGEIKSSRKATCTEIRQIIADSGAVNHDEHDQTRQELRIEVEQAAIRNQESNNATAQQIESIEVEIVNVVNTTSDINQAEHIQTQSQILELKQALRELSNQMALRNQELKEVLEAFQASKSKKSKKQLFERSKVVTAAIMALETMYRSLKAVLVVLQDTTKDLLKNVQSSDFWAINHYARRVVSTSSISNASQQLPIELSAVDENSPNPQSIPSVTAFSAHDVYFSYFYQGAFCRSVVIDANAMENRWKFRPECYSVSESHFEGFVVDDTPCSSSCLWLLASLALALKTHLPSEDAACVLLCQVFDPTFNYLSDPDTFADGRLSRRLKADISYWSSFAISRGMQDGMSEDIFDYGSLQGNQTNDLIRLLTSLLGRINGSQWPFETTRFRLHAEGGQAHSIVRSLKNVGLPFTIHANDSIDFGKQGLGPWLIEDTPRNGGSLI